MKDPIVFVADVHLDMEEHQRIADFSQFLLDMENQGAKIYIMGDLFNFWAGNAQSYLGSLRPFLKNLREMAQRRTILFLSGNRDFLFSWFFAKRYGGQIIHDGLILTLGHMRLLLYHGDSLCTGDIRYQKMKSYLQSRWVYLLSCLLPSKGCVKIGHTFRNMSKKEIGRKNNKDMDLNNDYMAKLIAQASVDGIICGHIHKKQIRKISVNGQEKSVYVLPDNTGESFGYLLWQNKALSFEQWSPKNPC